jgi:hypothetical protein
VLFPSPHQQYVHSSCPRKHALATNTPELMIITARAHQGAPLPDASLSVPTCGQAPEAYAPMLGMCSVLARKLSLVTEACDNTLFHEVAPRSYTTVHVARKFARTQLGAWESFTSKPLYHRLCCSPHPPLPALRDKRAVP